MLHTTMRYSVPEGSAEACRDAIRELVDHVGENEPETLRYTVLADSDGELCHFLHLGVFENHDSLRRHRESSAMQLFLDLIYPVTERGVEFNSQNVVGRIQPRPANVSL